MEIFIIIAEFVIFSGLLAGVWLDMRDYKCQAEKAEHFIRGAHRANKSFEPDYHISKTVTGQICVVRGRWENDCYHTCIIKVYYDADDEYNIREAQELIEKLNG